MRHEGVEGEIAVTEEAVPFHAAAGWEVIEDEPRAAEDEADGGEPDGEKTKSERPRASAAKKKES
jgi:hypothetical protein